MSLRRRLDITIGPCAWERPAAWLLAALGALSIVAAPMPWGWKPAFLVLILVAWRRVARDLGTEPRSVLTVYPDGAAGLADGAEERPAVLTGRAWLSRALCVIEVLETDSGITRWHRACAAANTPDDYRRLLGLLRLQPDRPEDACLD